MTELPQDPCPRCGHSLKMHNDAGAFGLLTVGQGQMCCYHGVGPTQWDVCRCAYDGPGAERVA